jgi:hypothetical protein
MLGGMKLSAPVLLVLLAAAPALAAPHLVERLRPPSLVMPAALDDGGGAPAMDARTKEVLSYVLAFVVGFGTGHLLMGDDQDFVFFLVVDAVLVVLAGGGPFFLGPIGWIAGAALFASHVWQVLDLAGAAPRMKDVRGGAPAWANVVDLKF